MNAPNEIEKLIDGGETLCTEFKSDRKNQLSDKIIYEDVVAFANASGGTYLIGVEDDGAVSGARSRHERKTEVPKLKSAIFCNTVPPINTDIEVVPVRGMEVIVISIAPQPEICATRAGKVLLRVIGSNGKPENIPYYPQDQRSRKYDLSNSDFSGHAIIDASFDSLDPNEFDRLRKTITSLQGDTRLLEFSDEELAKAMRLVESAHGRLVPNIAGLLLLGKEDALQKHLPTHQVYFQVIDDAGEVSRNEYFHCGLLKVISEIESRFNVYNKEKEVDSGLFRLPIPDYSPIGFREAINNALLHRDYSRNDAIYIQWYSDHIFISSPGGFPAGINIKNILVHEPKPRNTRLVEACRRINIVEQTGRGVDRIFMGQLRYGRPVPDYSRSNDTGVRIVLYGGRASLAFSQIIFEFERSNRRLSLDELMVLNALFRERRVDAVRVADLIQKDNTAARTVLEKLMEQGFIEARGERKGRIYHLSSSIYHKLGKTIDYHRTRGVSECRSEAMVLEYLEKQDKIARPAVMELLSMTAEQASRLLHRLCVSGKIVMKGSKPRWVYYTKP